MSKKDDVWNLLICYEHRAYGLLKVRKYIFSHITDEIDLYVGHEIEMHIEGEVTDYCDEFDPEVIV